MIPIMFATFRNRNFALLWTGQFVSLVGDYTLGVALAFYVLQLTGSILQTGLMFIIETVPTILFGSLAGVLVDRWDRRRTMIACNLLQTAFLFPLLFIRSPHLVWIVYLVAFTQSMIGLFFYPASNAFVPTLVEERQLTGANALESLSDSITRLVGPPLGGALLVFTGITSIVWIDAASFLFAATMLLLITTRDQRVRVNKTDAVGSLTAIEKKIWRELVDGLKAVRGNIVLTGMFVLAAVTLFGQGFVSVMFIVFVQRVLHGNGLVFGLMPAAQGVGALLGSLLVERALSVLKPAHLMAFCLSMIGLATLVFVQIPTLLLVLLMVILIGVCVVGSVVTKRTLVQINTSDSYRGRVFGALNTANSLAVLVGMCIATATGEQVGAPALLNVSALLYILAGLLSPIMLRGAKMPSEVQSWGRDVPH